MIKQIETLESDFATLSDGLITVSIGLDGKVYVFAEFLGRIEAIIFDKDWSEAIHTQLRKLDNELLKSHYGENI